MRRFLSLIIVLILSYSAVAIGAVKDWRTVEIIGIIFGVAVILAIILELLKLVGLFISNSLSSMLFVASSLAIVGLLVKYGELAGIVAYATTAGLSITLGLLVIRKLAEWSYSSLIISELFAFLSNYKIRYYIGERGLVSRQAQITYNMDFKNLVVVLRQNFQFNAKEAKEAALHAVRELPANAPLEDKIKKALAFMELPKEPLVVNSEQLDENLN